MEESSKSVLPLRRSTRQRLLFVVISTLIVISMLYISVVDYSVKAVCCSVDRVLGPSSVVSTSDEFKTKLLKTKTREFDDPVKKVIDEIIATEMKEYFPDPVVITGQPAVDAMNDANSGRYSPIAKSGTQLETRGISVMDIPSDVLFDENGIPLNYRYAIHGNSTAYCTGSVTATGTGVYPGIVAVNPYLIPYGTKMYIVADNGTVYGYASAQDTGGFCSWNNGTLFDLYMYSYNECINWGCRGVTAYIL